MDLLVLADKTGMVDMTPEAIARRTNCPIGKLMSALSALSAPDPRSKSKEDGGRRIVLVDPDRGWGWHIVNFEHYAKMRDENARREQNRIYQQNRRKSIAACQHDVSTRQHASAPSAHIDKDVDVDVDVKEEAPHTPHEPETTVRENFNNCDPNGPTETFEPDPAASDRQRFAEALVRCRPQIILSAGPREVAQLDACLAAHGLDALLAVVEDRKVKAAKVWTIFDEVESRAKAARNHARYDRGHEADDEPFEPKFRSTAPPQPAMTGQPVSLASVLPDVVKNLRRQVKEIEDKT